MNTIPRILLVILLAVSTAAHGQTLLQRLDAAHRAYWTKAFGDSNWRGAGIGFVVVKHTGMFHVVRQGERTDTVASFPVCNMDPAPGFKAKQGDGITPDGIYSVVYLNPASSYHLSMKINYPNAIDDKRHARHTRLTRRSWNQGGDIFIHGKCVSIGCIAMTDDVIEKLYLLVATRPSSLRRIPVLILPYDDEAQYQQMTFYSEEQFDDTGDSSWLLLREHLEDMRAILKRFGETGLIPIAAVSPNGRYDLTR